MSRPTFDQILSRLRRNTIFISTGPRPQRDVTYQFGVFLIRYGIIGSNAMEAAVKVSVGEGTVFNYCKRVVRAIREAGVDFVGWPDPQRKAVIKQAFREQCGLDGVIGVTDGSLLTMAEMPTVRGVEYLTQKKDPGVSVTTISFVEKLTVYLQINVQAVADHKRRFIAFESGWPGCKHDSFVWHHSEVWIERNRLFMEGEYLLGDRGE